MLRNGWASPDSGVKKKWGRLAGDQKRLRKYAVGSGAELNKPFILEGV